MVSTNQSKDVQGAGKLSVDAVVGITDIVENMHQTIASMGGLLGDPDQTRTRGITGIVYNSIRTITTAVGRGLDGSLSRLHALLKEGESSPGREAVLAALNGVLGDYLKTSINPLAIPMQFRHEGNALNAEELSGMIRQSGNRAVIMVHGLCMNDLQWNRNGHDYDTALPRDLGITPIYLHYNSGLHTSENGRELADRLQALVSSLSQPADLFIVAHSMGGLVARSACHYGEVSGHGWPKHLKRLIFLGTPHHGAMLEKGGNWIDTLLQVSPYSAPFARLGKIRSSGITDLRYGNVIDEDWQERDRFQRAGDQRTPVPLSVGVPTYCVAGTQTRAASRLGDELIGDGLVTVASALGEHRDPRFHLTLPESHRWVGRGLTHLDLLNHSDIYEKLKQWLQPD